MSVADELLKLNSLLEAGVITQEEFVQQKNKILNDDNTQPVAETNNSVFINQNSPMYKATVVLNLDLSLKNNFTKMVSGKKALYADIYFCDEALVFKSPDWCDDKFEDIILRYNGIEYATNKSRVMYVKFNLLTLFFDNQSYTLYTGGSLLDMSSKISKKMTKSEAIDYIVSEKARKEIIDQLINMGAKEIEI